MIEIEASLATLKEICKELYEFSNNSGIVLLRGNLASGKTTLVKEYADMLGIKDSVTSPTFSIMQSYEDRLFHYDLYNKELDAFLALGLLEQLFCDGIHFIEWGDEKLASILLSMGEIPIVVEISGNGEKRKYKIYAYTNS